jgi:phage shock protein C
MRYICRVEHLIPFDQMTLEGKKLYRSRDKMLGGVCGGVADYFGLDKSLVRIVFAALFLAGTLGFWMYLLMWIIIPSE